MARLDSVLLNTRILSKIFPAWITKAAIHGESRLSLSSNAEAEGTSILPVETASVRLARKPEGQHGVAVTEALLYRANKSIGRYFMFFDVPSTLEFEFITPGSGKKSAFCR